jgi:predicted AlkP superfamily phosphohydrolase/phosphomutase
VGAPLLVIGLDGATLDLVRPWAAAGRLPVLAGLMARGAWGRLRSTVPPATFPAWTSLVTGVNPGRHGVLDFTERVPGTYRVRFLNGSFRRVPALWNRLGAAGRRVAVVTVPATYPPEPVDGVMVSGFDSPLATAIDGSFVHPRALYGEIERVVGRVPFADFQEVATGPGWHAMALPRLLEGIERRTALVRMLQERETFAALMVVFGESDTVAHHFWRFHDRRSPRHAASEFGDAIGQIYAALDAAVGALIAGAPDATVAIVSDHGSGGASDRIVHLNRRLHATGLLAFRPVRSGGRMVAWLRAQALRAVPVGAQGQLLRRAPVAAGALEGMHRFGAIDWQHTVAYSEELDYHPSVRLNLCGREPEGMVPAAAYERTRARVADALERWRDERGRSVVTRVWRREELYTGPYVEAAPDLLVQLAEVDGYSPSCLRSAGPGPALRRLAPSEYGAGKGSGMNGAHRRDGLFVLAGPGVACAGELPAADIVDVLPTLLALGEMPVPAGLDGRPIAAALASAPSFAPDTLPAACEPPRSYHPADEGDVAARLAALGYLEPRT